MKRFVCVLAAVGCLCAAALPARADVIFDAATDFSLTQNPNGVWSYGQSATLASPLVLYTNTVREFSAIESWNAGSGSFSNPSVSHNPLANSVTQASITYQPGQLAFHPGPNGQFSVVRFVAPTAGDYSLQSSFTGLDFVGPTTTDVHVLRNGVSLFDGVISAFGSGPSFATSQRLSAGDTIDFKVGVGSDGTFAFDTTGLGARITLVPEPSSLVLFSLGTLAALGYARGIGKGGGLYEGGRVE
jgi:hypothetical protein